MEGLSSKWYHVVGENRVYFTKLPPGNYTFKVKAANLSGIWNDEPAMFQITILPPWWLSTKALILYGIIARTKPFKVPKYNLPSLAFKEEL